MAVINTCVFEKFMQQALTRACVFIASIISLSLPGSSLAEDILIALRAHKGSEQALAQWQPTADYLTEKIPGYRFIMVPFDNISALNQAMSRGEFHFCLTNPASGVEYQILYDAQPIATRVNKREGKGYSKFGSVIFTRAERKEINELKDLKGKTFIAVDELAFGGWRVAWKELLANGINPFTDFKRMRFAGGTQQEVAYAVRDGHADAGSVRTDMLERMAAMGEIKLSDFKVIGAKKVEKFPFWLSTDLYPEWMFLTTKKVDNYLKTQVIAALFSVPRDGPAATKGKYIGWISPLDYTPVEDLLKELQVGPYNVATMGPFERLISQYGAILLITILVITFLTIATIHTTRLNRRLSKTQTSLQDEISARESLERQLMQAQKMESLGQLTGGIAHDFNNMLTSIIGFTQLALTTDAVIKDKTLSDYLNQVAAAGDKAKLLVRQMLIFSRAEGDISNAEVVSVSDIINELHQLLRPLLPSSIRLQIKEGGEHLYIHVSRVMINQVLMNLCLNARDAITQEQGAISISTEAVNIESDQCNSCHQDFSGSYINICIEDSGHGIDPAVKERIFEPFFSTKEVSKGTGMGLSMVHGIIHQHDGHIQVESTPGKGTSIKLLLPKVSAPLDELFPGKANHGMVAESASSQKHILLVDDEVSITIYLSELLERHGYKVTAFNDSQDALSYFEEYHDAIDLVLTDQAMPEITGINMAAKMLGIRKDIPIILCTGYSEHVNEQVAAEMNIRAYLDKPIHSDQLLKQIKALTS